MGLALCTQEGVTNLSSDNALSQLNEKAAYELRCPHFLPQISSGGSQGGTSVLVRPNPPDSSGTTEGVLLLPEIC